MSGNSELAAAGAVFIDTNIGTHMAMSLSPLHITVSAFKRELERTHSNCFPKLGEIEVNAIKVKRKGCFYHLPDSLPIAYAFQGLKGAWFLHAEVYVGNHLDKSASSLCEDAKKLKDVEHLNKKFEKKNKSSSRLNCVSNWFTSNNSDVTNSATECSPDKTLVDVRVGNGPDSKVLEIPEFACRTPSRTLTPLIPNSPRSGRSSSNRKRPASVGKCVLVAANNFRILRDKRRPAISFYSFRGSPRVQSAVKSTLFEISGSDSDD